MSNGTNVTVLAMDYSKEQQVIRKIFRTASRLLTTNERASKMITDYLDPMVSNLKVENKPFDPYELTQSFLMAIRGEYFFGKR